MYVNKWITVIFMFVYLPSFEQHCAEKARQSSSYWLWEKPLRQGTRSSSEQNNRRWRCFCPRSRLASWKGENVQHVMIHSSCFLVSTCESYGQAPWTAGEQGSKIRHLSLVVPDYSQLKLPTFNFISISTQSIKETTKLNTNSKYCKVIIEWWSHTKHIWGL